MVVTAAALLLAMVAILHTSELASTLKAFMICNASAISGQQTYVAFRKTFDLSQGPQNVPFHPKRPESDTPKVSRSV